MRDAHLAAVSFKIKLPLLDNRETHPVTGSFFFLLYVIKMRSIGSPPFLLAGTKQIFEDDSTVIVWNKVDLLPLVFWSFLQRHLLLFGVRERETRFLVLCDARRF